MKIQSKLVNPTNSTQSVTKDSGYDYLGSVVVNPVKVKHIEIDGSTNDFVIDHTLYRTSLDGYSKINLKAVRMDAANVDSSSNDQVITSETGEGIKEVKVNKLKRETKTAYPTTDTQIFIPSGGKDAFSSFTLEKISSKTDESLIPENIKNGVNIFGVTGIAKEAVDHGNVNVDSSYYDIVVTPISKYDYYSQVTVKPLRIYWHDGFRFNREYDYERANAFVPAPINPRTYPCLRFVMDSSACTVAFKFETFPVGFPFVVYGPSPDDPSNLTELASLQFMGHNRGKFSWIDSSNNYNNSNFTYVERENMYMRVTFAWFNEGFWRFGLSDYFDNDAPHIDIYSLYSNPTHIKVNNKESVVKNVNIYTTGSNFTHVYGPIRMKNPTSDSSVCFIDYLNGNLYWTTYIM